MTIDEMQERVLNILAGYYGKNHVFHSSQKMPRFPNPYINIKFYKHKKTSSPICRFDEQEQCYKNYWTAHMDADINLYTKGENINKGKGSAVYKDTSMGDLEDFLLYLSSDEMVDALAIEAITTKAYRISAETGLISIPKKISITQTTASKSGSGKVSAAGSASSDSSNGIPGYEIEYLINGAIGINDLVQVESRNLNGIFRVKKQSYSGDNYSGDWKCTAQIVEVVA